MKLLIIEDDYRIIDAITISFKLGLPNMQIVYACEGMEGIRLVESESPYVIILDLGLPDISGYEVIEQIRLFSNIPILILTVSSDETNIAKALEMGANDYVIKPFKHLELIARIKNLLRDKELITEEKPLIWGPFYFDHARRKLIINDEEITLTNTENIILQRLIIKSPNIVTYSKLADSIWGDSSPDINKNIKVHIRRLREKIESDPSDPRIIMTKRNIGYYIIKPS